eukprot:CAMPEP_0198294470 /NCGR_PEP_ID=MMETSP1449-20131203/22508_1 /TAXON_ID=420275 /ORGANISM="Attheya septentrionalis, Strain CCMP2084" /LENGTH=255 /DNA_ID=CAMNT_0043994429 /DNA_START=10 /DNA_END=777 /DNA_ORIENTATION=-
MAAFGVRTCSSNMNRVLSQAAATTYRSTQGSALCSIGRTNTRAFGSTTAVASPDWHGTTILCVRKNGKVCMMGDGQVSMGSMVVKPNAKKIRKIMPKTSKLNSEVDTTGGTIVGFAGSTADAFTLLERLESKMDEYPGQLTRSCVELAKGWRTDKYLRRLEASLLVADENVSLELTGNGDVLESHDGILSVGSGSTFAMAAARALKDIPELSAEEVARRSMEIASDMCVYTNKSFMVEVLDEKKPEEEESKEKND